MDYMHRGRNSHCRRDYILCDDLMPDITMCDNKKCPSHARCYRFMARPDRYQQSYGAFDPGDGKQCDYFLSRFVRGTKNNEVPQEVPDR